VQKKGGKEGEKKRRRRSSIDGLFSLGETKKRKGPPRHPKEALGEESALNRSLRRKRVKLLCSVNEKLMKWGTCSNSKLWSWKDRGLPLQVPIVSGGDHCRGKDVFKTLRLKELMKIGDRSKKENTFGFV